MAVRRELVIDEIRTGNETLDIVVNEKVEMCRSEGITITFLGDGELLAFVSQYDIYSLFGNILDNAIEAVRKVGEKAKKIISLTIQAQGNCVVISSMNYFVGKLNLSDEGELVTTKTDNVESHGFGMRSIKLVAEKYNGDVRVSVSGDIFDLSVLIINPDGNRKRLSDGGQSETDDSQKEGNAGGQSEAYGCQKQGNDCGQSETKAG